MENIHKALQSNNLKLTEIVGKLDIENKSLNHQLLKIKEKLQNTQNKELTLKLCSSLDITSSELSSIDDITNAIHVIHPSKQCLQAPLFKVPQPALTVNHEASLPTIDKEYIIQRDLKTEKEMQKSYDCTYNREHVELRKTGNVERKLIQSQEMGLKKERNVVRGESISIHMQSKMHSEIESLVIVFSIVKPFYNSLNSKVAKPIENLERKRDLVRCANEYSLKSRVIRDNQMIWKWGFFVVLALLIAEIALQLRKV